MGYFVNSLISPAHVSFCFHVYHPFRSASLLSTSKPSFIFIYSLSCAHVCVCVLHFQIPIFNPLQQQQLSQFSPQQSQSATSSPQQQGETVRHAVTFTCKHITGTHRKLTHVRKVMRARDQSGLNVSIAIMKAELQKILLKSLARMFGPAG